MKMTTKCKKHPFEQGVGVCASCLRERLLDLVAAQSGGASSAAGLPRSVSPYVSRRRSVDLDLHADGNPPAQSHRRQKLRFFSTPQAGTVQGKGKGAGSGFFASIFGRQSRSEVVGEDYRTSKVQQGSISWFSALVPGRRKKMQQMRGNSRFFEEAVEEEEEDDDSPERSGAAESAGDWRIPGLTPTRKQPPSAQSAMAGFVVCLSPLVRPSPHRSQAGEASEPGGAARVSGQHRRHRSALRAETAALGHNRSRKIADLGRFP
ncbi:unnamed protein product [Spirodela intermedia]|uniref:Uncharacterized protein n=1 Tax=Spirodela intermedia TaxID=51605 RepID=A0A7I8JHW9_SPIIN|nr:unnamed protein product [Spirodela intermedia]CAA6669728.1 unnamed protein product [Spirodela intermedia]